MASKDVGNPNCSLCFELYTDPLMLSCLHSFCKKCLEKYKEGTKIKCPTCNVPTQIPDGIEGLPLNLRMSHTAEAIRIQKKMKNDVCCQHCQEKNAVKYCYECRMYMCDPCIKQHQSFPNLKDHKLISSEDEVPKIAYPLPFCSKHKNQELSFYCKKDEVLVCQYCLMATHKDHDREDIEDIAKSKRQQLDEATPRICDAITQLDKAITQGKLMRKQVQDSQKEAADKIDKMAEELIEAIQTRRKKLQDRCTKIAQGKDDVLSNQIQQFEKFKETVTFLREQVNDAITNHSAEELLSVKKTIKAQIDKVTTNFDRLLLQLQENQSINTSLDIASLKEQISVLGHFPGVPEPDNCSVIAGLSIPDAAVGSDRKFKVVLKDEKNQPLEGDALFQYTIVNKDVEDAPLPQVTITQSEAKDGTATLSINPNSVGEYELCLMVRNKPLNNFPFHMTVHQPCDYTNLPQPTVLNVETSQCRGIAIHPISGKIYVTDYSKNVVLVLSPDGAKIVQRIGSNDDAGGNLNHPWGIAIVDNVLYVASHSSNKKGIVKYSMSGRHIGGFGEYGTGEEQLRNPTGVCSDGNRHILVADCNNKRIKVFTTDGKLVQPIPCINCPYNVVVDVDGNIHAAIYGSGIIQVFAHDRKENESTQFSVGGYPTGIAIDANGYKMITEGSYSSMRIFNSNGEVARQSHCGYGVARDKHGAIYVADWSNPHIKKFKTIISDK